jgi:NitT/TauT family transport system permease protein
MLIAAEMVGAKSGLGWMVMNAQVNYQIPRLYLAAVIIALLGMALNYGIHWLERRIVKWKAEATAA